jgi:hypothetical protein
VIASSFGRLYAEVNLFGMPLRIGRDRSFHKLEISAPQRSSDLQALVEERRESAD